MPRYTMVTPQFTPVDYATRIRPLEQYKEEYDKRADALDEQGVLADAIGGLIDENKDPELAEQYKQFSDRLSNTVTNLMSTGDLGASRRDLSALRRSYANELVPIKTAYEDRAKDAEAFRNKKLQDPTFIGKDPLTHGLTEYLHGNKPNDKFVSGEVLYNAGAADAKAASSRRVIREKWGLDKGLGSQYFSQMIYQGWSQDEVQDALSKFDPTATDAELKEASEAVKYLQDATNRISNQARLDEFGDDIDSFNQSRYYILNGLLSGMTYKEDADYKNYDPSMWLDYRLKKKKLDGEDGPQSIALPYDSRPQFVINGEKKDETEYTNLLSDLLLGNKTLDTVVYPSAFHKDADSGAYSMSASYNNLNGATAGEVLYSLGKDLGVTGKDVSYETFISHLKTANASEFEGTMNTIANEIKKNAQRYSEYFTNVTDASKINQHVNDSNANTSDENSVIRDDKDKPISRLPHEKHGTYYLPTQESEGKKGLRYAAEEGKNYYVRPSAFQGTVAYSKDGTALSMKQAMNAYYRALSQKDGDEAQRLAQNITAFLAQYTIDRMPVQGDTSKEAMPSIP